MIAAQRQNKMNHVVARRYAEIILLLCGFK